MFRQLDITNRKDITDYTIDIGVNFCPFLSPSIDNGVMYFSEYKIENFNLEEIQKFIFYTGFVHTCIFRNNRIQETIHKRKLLYSENIVYSLKKEIDGEKAFAFPHWFLKILFTEKSILFGKFWKGESIKTREGINITIPPVHFLSIRSAIKPTDKRFFTLTPELTQYYLNSEDDNNSVVEFIHVQSLKNIISEIENLDITQINKEQVLLLVRRLMDLQFYNIIAEWCSQVEKSLGLPNYSKSQIK